MIAKDLKKHLINLSAFKSNQLVITDCLLLMPGRIATTNLLQQYEVNIDHQVKGAIEFDRFKKLVTALDPKDFIGFVADNEKQTVLIKINGVIQFSFPNITEEHPSLPKRLENSCSLTVGFIGVDFYQKLNTALKFVSKDDLRPSMNGVYISSEKIVSTNGHQLYFDEQSEISLYDYDVKTGTFDYNKATEKGYDLATITEKEKEELTNYKMKNLENIILPLKTATIISKQKELLQVILYTQEPPIKKDETQISFSKLNPWIMFIGTDFSLKSCLIEEKYPEFINVIPSFQDDHYQTILKTSDLEKTTKLALIAANPTTKRVEFKLEEAGQNKIRVYSEDIDEGTKYQKDIDAKKTVFQKELTKIKVNSMGEEEVVPVKPEVSDFICFNGELLLQIIREINTPYLEMQTNHSNRAAVINGKYLLMPVMKNDYS